MGAVPSRRMIHERGQNYQLTTLLINVSFSLILCIIYLGITVLHYVQSTPDNSNPQGKLKK